LTSRWRERAVGASERESGYVLQPAAGEPLIFCSAPNFGTFPEQDEVIYFVSEQGTVVVGDNRFALAPGTTAYVPRGVRHGFVTEEIHRSGSSG